MKHEAKFEFSLGAVHLEDVKLVRITTAPMNFYDWFSLWLFGI